MRFKYEMIDPCAQDAPSDKIKGTHIIYFSSSFYIIKQKPMIPTTHYHSITTWAAHSSG